MWKLFAVATLAATLLAPTPAAALENEELLALVAMPLAVAAVAEVTDVPTDQLMDVVSTLNNAAVPPQQFIEVLRYIPIALVSDARLASDEPRFVEFVRTQEQEGIRGTQLVNTIAERLSVYGVTDVELDVTRPRTIDVVEETFIPKPVRVRLAEARQHPHGGPPGQLKKELGVQTGAEVVHGRDDSVSERVVTGVVADNDRDRKRGKQVRPRKVKVDKVRIAARSDDHTPGRGKGNGNGNGKAKGKGKG